MKSSSASVISDTLPKSIMKPQRKEIVPDGLVRNTIGKIEETRRVQQTWNKENERRLRKSNIHKCHYKH